jgi:hypothetical protein
MLQGMATDTMDPATAVTWGPFIQAAYEQFVSDPSDVNPSVIKNMPAGYALVRTIQMTDFFGPVQTRVFYGFVAVGGDPKTAVVALRGTASNTEWWDDLHWDLVPFTQVQGGGKVAQGFYDIYSTLGTMTPGQQQSTPAPGAFAAEVAHAVADVTANTQLKPQAWTFASPQVGDAIFAARYGGLSTVSWRIYNLIDVVPYFPFDALDSYQPVTTGYAIPACKPGS